MKNYLEDSLRYPEADKKNGTEAVVFLSFVIDKNGAVETVTTRAMIGGSETIKAEAIRLVQSMPQWTPAKEKGKPVSSTHNTEIRFELADSLIRSNCIKDSAAANQPESMPAFMGGDPAMQWFIQMSMRYPKEELEAEMDGTVYVKFNIEKNGKVTDVTAVKGVPGAPGLSKEAVRIVQSFPRWTPGCMNGNPVKVTMTIPVKFVLQ